MTDEQLKALVREAVARHLGTGTMTTGADRSASCDHDRFGCDEPVATPPQWREHPSHHVYLTVVNTTDACVIEPSVTCNHCNYCKSHGH
jgi:hypothetical protein